MNRDEQHVGILTDTHFWAESRRQYGPDNEQLQPWSKQLFQSILSEFRKNKLDLVFHLGDYTCGGGFFEMPDDQFYDTLTETDQQLRQMDALYYGLPGNHDCPVGTTDYTFAEELFGLSPGLGRTVDTPHVRFVMVNTVGYTVEQKAAALPHDPVFGWLADAEIERVDHALATAGQRPVVLLTHQLLQPWRGPAEWNNVFGIANGTPIWDAMARHGNVRAVFQGHAHLYDVHTQRFGAKEITFVVCPPIICYPIGWLLLTTSPDHLRVQYRSLPLDDLRQISNADGKQSWRKPTDEWDEFYIPMR